MVEKLQVSKPIKNSKRPVLFWVDDDRTTRRIARMTFANSQFKCVTARSGAEAIEMLNTVKPDLILLDIEMPGMNGFETCSNIMGLLEESERINPPVLMVSSHKDITHLDRAYDLGIHDIVSKPIRWKLLVDRIRFILNANKHS